MKKAFRKITKAISITTTILLSNVFLAYSAFAEGGGIGEAPSSVNTATYKTLVTLVFWVVRIVVLGSTAIPGLVKIGQGVGNEDVRDRQPVHTLPSCGQEARLHCYSDCIRHHSCRHRYSGHSLCIYRNR